MTIKFFMRFLLFICLSANKSFALPISLDLGKSVVEKLIATQGHVKNTTLCRLENKCVVSNDELLHSLDIVAKDGLHLEEREQLDLPAGARSGTFTFYGASLKFAHPNSLVASIKMRIRMYFVEDHGVITRAALTKNHAFLELKIKNPLPDFPLSVHKYRLLLPDDDLLALIWSNPNDEHFSSTIKHLKQRAHTRDISGKDALLIEAMFDQIEKMALAQPQFVRPIIGVRYYRNSKKFDMATDNSVQSYELTVDQNIKAYYAVFYRDELDLGIEKYFKNADENLYLLAHYPEKSCVVEFKQPDAIGYQGPGKIRRPEDMNQTQRVLWEAFVGNLSTRALTHTTQDAGKFAHIKDYISIETRRAPKRKGTILTAPGKTKKIRTTDKDE